MAAKRRIGGGEGEFHVLRVPLRLDERESRIVGQRLLAVGLLKRAFLRLLLKRVNAMHRDPEWAAARKLPHGSPERAAAFEAVRARHGLALSQMDASELCKTLWRGASRERTREFADALAMSRELAFCLGLKPRKERAPLGWMPTVIAARVAGAAGKEVWKSVEEYLYGQRGRPKVKPPHLNRAAWNEDNTSGLFGTSPTTRCAPPARGSRRWTCAATSAVMSASHRKAVPGRSDDAEEGTCPAPSKPEQEEVVASSTEVLGFDRRTTESPTSRRR